VRSPGGRVPDWGVFIQKEKKAKTRSATIAVLGWANYLYEQQFATQPIIKSTQSGFVIATLFAVAEEPSRRRSRNRKWMGEVAESAFLWKAMQLGLLVAKPWGDSARYDFIVDSGRGLLRVQVKSTGCLCEEHRYAVAAHGSNPAIPYTKDDIDFLVAFIPPEDAWYILPVEVFTPRTHLWLYPQGEHDQQYESYREAWSLLGVQEGPE
jgi:PD-(D/E)XK endonuclease